MSFFRAGSNATTVKIHIEGMACSSCAERVEKVIRATPGVATATVDIGAGRATVTFSGVPDAQGIIAAISAAGYQAAIEKS